MNGPDSDRDKIKPPGFVGADPQLLDQLSDVPVADWGVAPHHARPLWMVRRRAGLVPALGCHIGLVFRSAYEGCE